MVEIIDWLHNKMGIAHRDIKPDNFFVDASEKLRISDFENAVYFKDINDIV